MSAPQNASQTVQIVDDAIAFTKAADASGLKESVARAFAAALGELPEAQARRICIAALDHRRKQETRIQRNGRRSGR